MKRIISLFLILALVLSISSCFDYKNPATTTQQTFSTIYFQDEYFTFEHACRSAESIVIGKFIDYAPSVGDYWVLEFEVIDTIFGKASDTIQIYLHGTKSTYHDSVTNKNYTFSPKDAGFYLQGTYLIPLKIVDDVYQDFPYAYPIGCALVDINDISKSEMYGRYIQQHATGINFSDSTAEDIIEYVKELSANNTHHSAPLESDNLEEIVNASEKIAHIKVEDFVKRTDATFFDIEFYKCTVVENLKGEFEKNSEITVVFFSETVVPGEEYIVMLAPGGAAIHQRFSSKNSLRSISEKSLIKSLLK